MKTKTAFQIIEAAQRVAARNKWRNTSNRLDEITSAPHYSERGYSTTKPVILFGNWNKPARENYVGGKWVPKSKSAERENAFFAGVCKALEAVAELEWSDEWATCSDCGGAVRISGDSYGWQRAYVELDGEIICHECAQKHADEIIETFEGDDSRCLTSDLGIDLAEHGFAKLPQEFEHGLYGGQDADPRKIAAALRARGVSRFVFQLDSVGQFDARFSVWIPEDESLPVELPHNETACDLDPAEGMRRALSNIPPVSGEGITYVKCDASTGTATARKVNAEEFRDGIKE